MQAVEFEADIQNGMIPLPRELQLRKTGHLRIIALFQEAVHERQSDLAEALSFPGRTGGFDLNWDSCKETREQMNER
jgi:hypothetical protein